MPARVCFCCTIIVRRQMAWNTLYLRLHKNQYTWKTALIVNHYTLPGSAVWRKRVCSKIAWIIILTICCTRYSASHRASRNGQPVGRTPWQGWQTKNTKRRPVALMQAETVNVRNKLSNKRHRLVHTEHSQSEYMSKFTYLPRAHWVCRSGPSIISRDIYPSHRNCFKVGQKQV